VWRLESLRLLSGLSSRRPAPGLPSRLGGLFDALAACREAQAAERIEEEIWRAWMYHGREEAERALDLAASDLAAGRYEIAETRLAALVRHRPDWSEAWHKQATLHYLTGNDAACLVALHRALALEPRHFGALCALGEIYRGAGDPQLARLAFAQALRLHPHHAGARGALAALAAGR